MSATNTASASASPPSSSPPSPHAPDSTPRRTGIDPSTPPHRSHASSPDSDSSVPSTSSLTEPYTEEEKHAINRRTEIRAIRFKQLESLTIEASERLKGAGKEWMAKPLVILIEPILHYVSMHEDRFDSQVDGIHMVIRRVRRDVGELTGRVDTLTVRVDDLSGKVDVLTVRVDDLTVKVDVLSERVDVLTERMDVLSDRVDDLTVKVDVLTERMDTLTDRVDVLTERMDVLTDRVDVLTERVDILTERVDGLSDKIDDLGDRVTKLENNFETFRVEVNTRFDTMDTKLDEVLRLIKGQAK